MMPTIILFFLGEEQLIATRSARTFWVSFWLVFLVIVTTYSGNLVAALATQHIQLPFTTINELAEDTTYQVTIPGGGAFHTLLQVKSLFLLFLCEKERKYQILLLTYYVSQLIVIHVLLPFEKRFTGSMPMMPYPFPYQ